MVPGIEYSLACFPVEKLIGKANLRPMATILREMSVPGTGHEFQTYMSKRMALRAIQVESSSFVMIRKPALSVDIGLVEKPFQHTCLYHLQDCVVNGD
jgi:hypothetical protein